MCHMLLQVACILRKGWDLQRQDAPWNQNALSTPIILSKIFAKGAEGSVNQDRFWQEDWVLKHLDSIHDLLCASGSNVSAMALGRCDMIW